MGAERDARGSARSQAVVRNIEGETVSLHAAQRATPIPPPFATRKSHGAAARYRTQAGGLHIVIAREGILFTSNLRGVSRRYTP